MTALQLTGPVNILAVRTEQRATRYRVRRAFTEMPPPSPPATLLLTAPEAKVAAPAISAAPPPSALALLLSSRQLFNVSVGGAGTPVSPSSSSCTQAGVKSKKEPCAAAYVRARTYTPPPMDAAALPRTTDVEREALPPVLTTSPPARRRRQTQHARHLAQARRTAADSTVAADIDAAGHENAAAVHEGTAACSARCGA